MFEFEIKNSRGKFRTGILKTPHGKIETPNLAIVATNGGVKFFDKQDHEKAKLKLTISNTFHLFVNKKIPEIKKAGGIHNWSGLKNPIMTDSGGFQVFSLGWGKTHAIGKVLKSEGVNSLHIKGNSQVKISENGVVFEYSDKKYELTPEKSIKLQKDIGADIIFAFDECTSPLHDHAYNKKAVERTHRWAVRCLEEFNSKRQTTNNKQMLFGIVQGGIYKDLREKSSKIIGSLPFGGFGIGGSFGEKQMKEVLGWALSGLPGDKPRHLLGIGKLNDIFIAVKQGIDLFDCVIPTREARHGRIYVPGGKLAIEKEIFSKDKKLIDKNCDCWVCKNKISRRELRELFKNDKMRGQKLAMLHNIQFYKNLFAEIRESAGKMEKLEKKYYNYLKGRN
ncbi:MAG: tRNA guanosine(34) transglycosylase Tgt [Candidatus Paceibacterota bacterium]